jgi:hypothetical protein
MSGDNRNESMSALDEILGAFTSKQVNIDELPEGDPAVELGRCAILFVGAQVVDFYNDRLISDRAAPRRWHAYEAEFLRTLRQHLPGWTPNDYQRQILEKFPDGLDTAGVDLYPIKAYAPARGTA